MAASTVSRALNDSPEASKSTKALVRKAADQLGYVANQSARSLRQGMTGTVGFMIHTGPGVTSHGDFFMGVSDGLQTVFAPLGLDLVAMLCGAGQDPGDYLRRMVTRNYVDAVIISSTMRFDARIEMLAARNVPFVTLGRSLTDGGQPWLDSDFESYAATAVERLVKRGHCRFAVTLPTDDINTGFVFHESVEHELARHSLSLAPEHVVRTTPTEQGGYEAALRLMTTDTPPTAVLLCSEYHTTGLYRGLAENGKQVGKDVAVIGLASCIPASSLLRLPLSSRTPTRSVSILPKHCCRGCPVTPALTGRREALSGRWS